MRHAPQVANSILRGRGELKRRQPSAQQSESQSSVLEALLQGGEPRASPQRERPAGTGRQGQATPLTGPQQVQGPRARQQPPQHQQAGLRPAGGSGGGWPQRRAADRSRPPAATAARPKEAAGPVPVAPWLPRLDDATGRRVHVRPAAPAASTGGAGSSGASSSGAGSVPAGSAPPPGSPRMEVPHDAAEQVKACGDPDRPLMASPPVLAATVSSQSPNDRSSRAPPKLLPTSPDASLSPPLRERALAKANELLRQLQQEVQAKETLGQPQEAIPRYRSEEPSQGQGSPPGVAAAPAPTPRVVEQQEEQGEPAAAAAKQSGAAPPALLPPPPLPLPLPAASKPASRSIKITVHRAAPAAKAAAAPAAKRAPPPSRHAIDWAWPGAGTEGIIKHRSIKETCGTLAQLRQLVDLELKLWHPTVVVAAMHQVGAGACRPAERRRAPSQDGGRLCETAAMHARRRASPAGAPVFQVPTCSSVHTHRVGCWGSPTLGGRQHAGAPRAMRTWYTSPSCRMHACMQQGISGACAHSARPRPITAAPRPCTRPSHPLHASLPPQVGVLRGHGPGDAGAMRELMAMLSAALAPSMPSVPVSRFIFIALWAAARTGFWDRPFTKARHREEGTGAEGTGMAVGVRVLAF